MSVKTICIDARLYGYAHTGIGRYVANLIRFLPADKHTRIVLIVSPADYSNPQLQAYPRFIARFHPYHPLAQLEMPLLALRIRADLLHVPHFSIPVLWPGRLVVTVHDLIKNISRGRDTTTRSPMMYHLKYLGYLFVLKLALLRARKIFVPAKYWREILIRDYRIDPSRIIVTYEGVDTQITRSSVPTEFALPKPLVVYTGNLYPHKNVPVLLRAIKLFNGEVHLAIVCARSVFTQRFEKMVHTLNLEKEVVFLGRLTDAQLSSLYAYADLFVFPSLIEGFGLPGLEAMAVGLPVIAAKASCLPEIYRQAALYFNPHDPKDLQLKISRVLADPALRANLISRGQKLVKLYSWPKMAKITWTEYQNALR